MQISRNSQIAIVAIAAVALIAIALAVFFLLEAPVTELNGGSTSSPTASYPAVPTPSQGMPEASGPIGSTDVPTASEGASVPASSKPTVPVSAKPSTTIKPSATSTPKPSAQPSTEPSATSTPKPSVQPSAVPTVTPVQYSIYVDPVNGNDSNDGKSVNSPVKTIAQAQTIVKANNTRMEKDINVYLRGGTYYMDSTLIMTVADSGKNGHTVIWKAYNNEKPVLSGGKQITGWTVHDSRKNIWVANAPKGIMSRDFFVNGERATRARFEGMLNNGAKTDSGFTFTKGALPSLFARPQDLEMHINMLWQYSIMPLSGASYSGDTLILTAEAKAWRLANVAIGTTKVDVPYVDHLENAYEFIDCEGEWYLDVSDNKIYYKPKAGQNMSNVTAVLGNLEEIVNMRGSTNAKVENITFSGITFSHTTWLQASKDEGLSVIQSNIYKHSTMNEGENFDNNLWEEPSSAVYGMFVNNVTFTGNTFKNLGNGGIHLARCTNNSKITKNSFYDCASTGITLGGFAFADHYNNGSDKYFSLHNVIEDNRIDNVGTVYRSACGILVGYVGNTSVSYNTLTNLPYTGISFGWGWGFNLQEVNNAFPVLQGSNSICNNYIENIMNYMFDGGGIYTLGRMDGTVMKNNYINLVNNDYGAIYLDNGSQGFTITNNVISNAHRNWIYKGDKNYIYDNYTSPGTAVQPDLDMREPGHVPSDYRFEHDENYNWDVAKVNAIKEAAGVRE